MLRPIVLTVLLALSPAAAPAQSVPQLMQTGAEGRGWQAVGKLDLGGGSFCTGALIAPDLVLTAAHCLVDKATGKTVDPGQVSFLAGWRNGRAEAYRGARRIAVDPAYLGAAGDRVGQMSHDLGLIGLEMPIRLPSLLPLAVDADTPPGPGDPVGVVSYAQGHAEVPALQSMCDVLVRERGVLLMDCKADFGASGSPVMAMRGGEPKIVAVMSAKAMQDGKPVSLAALPADLAGLRAALAAGAAERPTGAGGAKFMRP